jgi:cell division transport system permease protein
MKETARRIIRFGVTNYIRNGWLSLAATFVVAMTLFTVSVFALQNYVIKSATKSIQDKLDMSVYITDTPSEEEVATFVTTIKMYPEVKEVIYLNKTQVIEEWNKFHVDQKIKNQINAENNPLPRTIKIKTFDPASLDTIATRINESTFAPNIRNVSYRNNRPVIQQLTAQSKKTIRNGLIISSIFMIIAVIFVYNTIRLIIRFRQDEISIMKLVGATDSFIQGPFLIEGALYGIVAGVVTLIALYFYLKNGLSESTTLIASPDALVAEQLLQFFTSHVFLIGAALIGAAVLLAIGCSWVSLYKHLKR